MFTGIITNIGILEDIKINGDAKNFKISIDDMDFSDVEIGASIACNGMCLTVTKKDNNSFYADVSKESLKVTTADSWQVNEKINIERAAKFGDEIGGHLVTGHVDAVAQINKIMNKEDHHIVKLSISDDYVQFMAKKGSVCINGVSLTVNEVENNVISLNIIPHTWEVTNLGDLEQDAKVNFEIDLIARYVKNSL